jgi:hypothetical protein
MTNKPLNLKAIIKSKTVYWIFMGMQIFTFILIIILIGFSIVMSIGNFIKKDYVPALVVELITFGVVFSMFVFHK